MNNLRQIALAIQFYHDVHGQFPPPYVADADGNPMHSWRVLILPHMEEARLFKQYNMNEPWNGPNNSKLAKLVPEIYKCASQPQNDLETHYFAIVGPETVWPEGGGRTLAQVADGSSQTLMLIEATGLGINWMEPRDVSVDEAIELLTTRRRSGHHYLDERWLTRVYYETSYRNVAYCDGHVTYIGQFSDAEIAKALLTVSGDRFTGDEFLQVDNFYKPQVRRVEIKWAKVYALATFIIVSLLPIWMKKRRTNQAETAGAGDA